MSHHSWELSEANMKKYQLGWAALENWFEKHVSLRTQNFSKDLFSDLKPTHKAHLNLNIQAPIMSVCY